MTPEQKARLQAGRDRYNADIRELVRMGVLSEAPMRRTGGAENRIARARVMIAEMKAKDAVAQAAGSGEPSYAQRWDAIHGKSLDFYDEVLSTPVPVENDNAKLLNIKAACASKVFSINAKIEIAKYRGERPGALNSLLARIEALEDPRGLLEGVAPEGPVIEADPDPWGLDEEC
jgi:hypothetical protein